MLRILISAVFAVVLSAGVVLAEEVKAKIKSIEPHSIVVTVDGKDHKVEIGKETKLLDPKDNDLKGGLKNPHLKEGVEVTITLEEKDGKKVCTKVKLAGK